MGDALPRISYFTLMNAFLIISFMTISATVIVNLTVGAFDKRGDLELGDRIDRCCRRVFPIAYLGLMLASYVAARVMF